MCNGIWASHPTAIEDSANIIPSLPTLKRWETWTYVCIKVKTGKVSENGPDLIIVTAIFDGT